ncbi:BPSL0761 family protein [Paraburkholderia guartelaensis]|uniref:BPSL0761 family protein n=1 Tax=Paraburkholderia guartelaensis TaxID=2546446 RepID=A0ABU9SBY5_9BURK
MTTPEERSRAVIDVRWFLETLANATHIDVPGLVQTVAILLLRHYPTDMDLADSALKLPQIWADVAAVGRASRTLRRGVTGGDIPTRRATHDEPDTTSSR